jgi:hypothetical protein
LTRAAAELRPRVAPTRALSCPDVTLEITARAVVFTAAPSHIDEGDCEASSQFRLSFGRAAIIAVHVMIVVAMIGIVMLRDGG